MTDEQRPDVISTLPWQEIFWQLAPPTNVMGVLDWASGLVLLNEDAESYDRMAENGPKTDYERELIYTFAHEATHFYQVLLTGYLYDWAARLNAAVRTCVRDLRGERVLDGFQFDELVSFVDDFGRRVPAESASRVKSLLRELEHPGPNGLSPLAIAEGHATYVELCRNTDVDRRRYVELAHAPDRPGIYHLSYDVLSARLGSEAAFNVLPIVSCLALCSSDPAVSFGLLTDELCRADLSSADLNRAARQCCGYVDLGSPIQAPSTWPSNGPYESALQAVRQEVANGKFDLFEFFLAPTEHIDSLSEIASPAVVFSPMPEGRMPIRGGRPKASRYAVAANMLLASLVRKVFDSPIDQESDSVFEETHLTSIRRENLQAARDGQLDALFNLGLLSARAGKDLPARLWWRLASAAGDEGSIRALTMSLSLQGRDSHAVEWFDVTAEAVSAPLGPEQLLRMGGSVRALDPELAVECFRRAADQDSVRGAYLAGKGLIDEDPSTAVYYLALAAGNPTYDEEASFEAHKLIGELRARWGRRRLRRQMKKARNRMREELDSLYV